MDICVWSVNTMHLLVHLLTGPGLFSRSSYIKNPILSFLKGAAAPKTGTLHPERGIKKLQRDLNPLTHPLVSQPGMGFIRLALVSSLVHIKGKKGGGRLQERGLRSQFAILSELGQNVYPNVNHYDSEGFGEYVCVCWG